MDKRNLDLEKSRFLNYSIKFPTGRALRLVVFCLLRYKFIKNGGAPCPCVAVVIGLCFDRIDHTRGAKEREPKAQGQAAWILLIPRVERGAAKEGEPQRRKRKIQEL